MARPIDLTQRREFVLPAERDLHPDLQTTWIFKPLSSVHRVLLEDLLRQSPQKDSQPSRYVLDYLRHILVGWRNYPTGKAAGEKDAPFVLGPDGLPTNETLAVISFENLAQLLEGGRQIQNALSEEQRGKS